MKNRKTTFIFLSLLIMAIALILSSRQNRMEYTSFLGEKHVLQIRESEEIILLYGKEGYDREKIAEMLAFYDLVYRLFIEICGDEPKPSLVQTEKLPLAIVPNTCGPGCGLLGAKGIEMTESKFSQIYNLYVDSLRHDHLFFYELGRNFWLYEDVLTYPGSRVNDDIRTGFAIFMRNVAIRELGIHVGSINGIFYKKYMENNHKMWDRYMSDSTATLENTLLGEKDIGGQGSFHKPNLWAAFWWDLYSREGYRKAFLQKFLHGLENQGPPESEAKIFLNFYRSACSAANRDLNDLFVDEWKWNILHRLMKN